MQPTKGKPYHIMLLETFQPFPSVFVSI